MQDLDTNLLVSTVLYKYKNGHLTPSPSQAQVNSFYFTCSHNERPEVIIPISKYTRGKKISIIRACFTTC